MAAARETDAQPLCACGEPAILRFGRCQSCWLAHIASLVGDKRPSCPDCGVPVANAGCRCRSCGQRARRAEASVPTVSPVGELCRVEPDDPPPKPIRFAPRCVEDGCDRPRYLRDLCDEHYYAALSAQVADDRVLIAA